VALEQSKKVGVKGEGAIDSLDLSAQSKLLQSEKPRVRGKIVERRESDIASSNNQNDRRVQTNRRKPQDHLNNEKAVALEQVNGRNEIKLQQHRRKILLAGCEPVMGFNYDCLAMDDYPNNALVSGARRDRDYWLLLCSLFATAFLLGIFGIVAAWVAGAGCGLFLLSLVFAFTSFRKHFFERPPLHELLKLRKKIEFSALNHLHFLEGADGLAWRCQKLAKYNLNLERNIFNGLFRYSKDRELLSVIKNKKHIRLYLLLMIESQKGYKRLQKDYLEQHFSHMDQGWDDTISAAEAAKIEQTLNIDDSNKSTRSTS
jgi:hypothetical protein